MSGIQYATRRFTIPAGDLVETMRDSNLLTCLSASAPFLIRFDDGSENDFDAGLTYQPANGFSRLSMRNDTGADIDVWLAFGKGDIKDSRVTISSGQQLNVRQAAPATYWTALPTNCPDGATTLVSNQSPEKMETILSSPMDAAGVVLIAHAASAGAGVGVPLYPGQSVTLATSDAVYIRNDTGADVDIYKAELGDW